MNNLEKKISRLEFYSNQLIIFNPIKKLDGYKYKLDIMEKTLLKLVQEKCALLNRHLKDNFNKLDKYLIDYAF